MGPRGHLGGLSGLSGRRGGEGVKEWWSKVLGEFDAHPGLEVGQGVLQVLVDGMAPVMIDHLGVIIQGAEMVRDYAKCRCSKPS